MPSLYLFFTQENPTFALVLYKRHKNSWRQYKWILETDELIKGQWISKPLVSKYAILHPSGEYFYYTYYTYDHQETCICGVVSRPLNFTAVETDNKFYSSFRCESAAYYYPPPLFHHLFKTDDRHLVLQSTHEYESCRKIERDIFKPYQITEQVSIDPKDKYR